MRDKNDEKKNYYYYDDEHDGRQTKGIGESYFFVVTPRAICIYVTSEHEYESERVKDFHI